MERLQTPFILKDLQKKIVFLVGPRQVGKTWLAKSIGASFTKTVSLNYDSPREREVISKQQWPPNTELLVLDELHKMDLWKNFLKGVFDTRPEGLRIIVTGSARLDLLREAGDSMAGRFFSHRLLPLSLVELKGGPHDGDFDRLLERGGFPEPFLAEDPLDARRWRTQYLDGLIREDILAFENVQQLRAINLLVELLRTRVGSPVSFSSLARDISVSPSTVIKYTSILEALYIIFRVTPFARNIARSLVKEPKIYFYDIGLVPESDSGARLENLVAVSLLKQVHALYDYRGEEWRLHYLRTKDGRETDFCLVRDNRIISAIEVKSGEDRVSDGLGYFCSRYQLPGIQAIRYLRNERQEGTVAVRRLKDFLMELAL
jgi:predicted AAA+ superfamily ATPase